MPTLKHHTKINIFAINKLIDYVNKIIRLRYVGDCTWTIR